MKIKYSCLVQRYSTVVIKYFKFKKNFYFLFNLKNEGTSLPSGSKTLHPAPVDREGVFQSIINLI